MANRLIDVFPATWFDCDLKQLVIDYIAALPVPPEDRKAGFLDWCRITGCDCTAEDFSAVTGLPPGEI